MPLFSSLLIRLLAIPALVCALASLAQAADPLTLSLSNSTPAQCDTIDISWSGGTPKYTIVIDSQLTPVLTTPALVFANLTNSSVTWTADRCGGVPVYIMVTDGAEQQSNVTVTLGLSANMSCLSDQEKSSAQCLSESASLHLPSATTTPSSASREVRVMSTVPFMVLAGLLAGVALCAA